MQRFGKAEGIGVGVLSASWCDWRESLHSLRALGRAQRRSVSTEIRWSRTALLTMPSLLAARQISIEPSPRWTHAA